ncbi:MAG: hypothetical protein UU87_C0009G0005 [Parcubacteria group bacterium GW2011_GWA2_42_11]|nr:MAG: hypothetical protein UU87_C0009G0005 [Parcubacteria group bacterium GW2011_GWA2_42_11]
MQMNLKRLLFSKFVSSITILALLAIMVAPQLANAGTITSAKATFGRLKIGINSEFGTIEFATPTGIQAGTSDDIILTFSSEFVLAAEAAVNYDIELGDSATCSTASYADEGVALTADASNWGIDVTGDVLTLEPDTDSSLTAGFCMRLVWGTAATTGGTGAVSTIVNATDADDDDTIVFTGGFGDTGTITVDMIDDDQVSVTATVNQSITFDLDTGVADGETGTPYSAALGTITVTDTRVSGSTDSVNMIIAEVDTNASGGAVITVRNANGANGLKSTAVPGDDIASADGAMVDGTENYGLCVMSVTQTSGTLAKASPYDTGTCATNSETNDIQGLTTTGENILNTSTAPIAGGHAEIAVNAAISGVTVAHSDYTDTLTFIATGTF